MAQEAESTTPQVGTQPAPAQDAGDELKELRSENAKWRLKLRETERALADREAEKAAHEKKFAELNTQFADLTKKQSARALEYEAKILAIQKGAVDPDVAFKLLNTEQIKLGDDGKFEGLSDAIDTLLKEKPYLVGSTSNGAHAQTSNVATGNPVRKGSITREQLKDRKFYEEHKDEIMQAFREGRIAE